MEPTLTIVLTLTDDGQVGIKADGPGSANKIAMLGLLELAKNAVMNQTQQQSPPSILPGALLPRNGRR